MSVFDWSVAGSLLAAGVAILLPWMLAVNARLAVLATRLAEVQRQLHRISRELEDLSELERQRYLLWVQSETRLQAVEARLDEAA